jgi:hypothetical protein
VSVILSDGKSSLNDMKGHAIPLIDDVTFVSIVRSEELITYLVNIISLGSLLYLYSSEFCSTLDFIPTKEVGSMVICKLQINLSPGYNLPEMVTASF